jgi:hypothetical protein
MQRRDFVAETVFPMSLAAAPDLGAAASKQTGLRRIHRRALADCETRSPGLKSRLHISASDPPELSPGGPGFSQTTSTNPLGV